MTGRGTACAGAGRPDSVQAPGRRLEGLLAAAVLACSAGVAPATAHEPVGAPAPSSAVPADVVLDKSAQRRAGIRTAPAASAVPRIEIAGRAIADPRTARRIAADQPGRIEPPEGGFPQPGSRVRAGEVLAWLVPVMSDPDRRDLDAERTSARRDVAIGKLQVDHFHMKEDEAESIDVQLPTPSIQILSDYRAARAREGELGGALASRLPLKAPVDGTVTAGFVRGSRVVVPGAPLFDIAATGGVAIEAFTADERADPASVVAARTSRGTTVAVRLVSSGFDAASRMRRLLYEPAAGESLAPGEPVALSAAPAADGRIRWLPKAALAGLGERRWIWIHEDAERFVALPVTAAEDDGAAVRVAVELDGAARVVVAGTSALTAAGRAP